MDKERAAKGLGTGIAVWRGVPVPSLVLDDGLGGADFSQQLGIGCIPLVNGFEVLLDQTRGLFLF